MAALRRNLRSFAATCLVLQFAWLTAFVPRDCCASHRPAPASERSCHEPPPAEDDACALRGACDGPMAALRTFLSNHGPVPSAATPLVTVAQPLVSGAFDETVRGHFERPDPPPPRA